MTGVVDRPVEAPPALPNRPRRGGTLARWRVAARLARRQVARTKLSSALVATLVALPIAGMTAFLVFVASYQPTVPERARVELGQTEAWIAVSAPPGVGLWQVPDEPDWTGYPPTEVGGSTPADATPLDDPTSVLPAGTEVLHITNGSARVESPSGIALLDAWTGPAWDERMSGRFDLVEGRRPSAPDEAMATPATFDRLGIPLGGDVTLAATGDTVTVVGTLAAATLPDADSALFLPDAFADAVTPGFEDRWYLPDLALSWDAVRDLNAEGIVALSREVLFDPPTSLPADIQRTADQRWMSTLSSYMSLAIGGLFAAYVVVMLAGAAFAVAARRQQRALAIAASVGATGRDLFRTVVLQGTALGAVGGVVGVGLGVGIVAGTFAVTATGQATNPWGFHVPWQGVAAILVFAVLVGTASALVPARSVARADAIRALRGARRPVTPRASRPLWGSLLIVVGIALTVVSGLLLAAIQGGAIDLPPESLRRSVPVWGIVIGPILMQIGILVSGRWLLWMTSRALTRVSTAARIASRDAAANAARTVPAFAAIGATVFLGVFAVAVSSMSTAQSARTWTYTAPIGSASMEVWSMTGDLDPLDAATALESGAELLAQEDPAGIATIARQPDYYDFPTADDVPEDLERAFAILPERHLLDPDGENSFTGPQRDNNLSVIEPDELASALGIDIPATTLAAYRAGTAIVTEPRYVTDGAIDVAAFAVSDVYEGRAPNNIWLPFPDQPDPADPRWQERVDAVVVDAPPQSIDIAIAPATAEALGLVAAPQRVIAAFDAPLGNDAVDRLRAQTEVLSSSTLMLTVNVETGPASAAAWMVPLLAAVSVLVVGASTVALGLARFERRPDDATLAAVGATAALRRRVAFWQGLLVAGFGTVAGAAAGVLPAVGLSIQSPDTQRLADVPWLVLAGFAVALPLLIATANALIPPRRPDLTRRTVIA